MAKGSSGFDKGGRNGSSYLTSKMNEIPSEQNFKISKAPQITGGTEEEVKEATRIRNKIGRELVMYAISKTSDGNPSGLYEIAKQGMSAIKKNIESSSLINSASGKVKQEKIDDAINGYKDLAKRISRYNKIISNSSASYWLKNRTDQSENYDNKKLKKKIDGK